MKLLLKILAILITGGVIFTLAGLIYIYSSLLPDLPSIDNLDEVKFEVPLRIYDKNEDLLAVYGKHRRTPVRFKQIPDSLQNAFISAEDDQYWSHIGVDPLALLAAAYELIVTGRKTRGGSTITMQVARNFFLSSKKTYSRKLNEILLALKIEQHLSKQRILELYLNKIFLGHRSYGIVAAAQVYYGKKLDQLTIAQSAMIAGLPKAPSRYNPVSNPERALIRRDHILNRMRYLKYITDEEYQQALAEPVSAELHIPKRIADASYITEMVRNQLFEQYGEDAYRTGIKVYTSIDGHLQKIANQSLRKALMDYDRRHGYRGIAGKVDLNQEGLDPFDEGLVSDSKTGGLRQGVITAVDEESATATVLLSNYKHVLLPFKEGIDWAKPYINENRVGKAPENISDLLAKGDIIWLDQQQEKWQLASIPDVEGALVSIDPDNGAIRALVGGFDFFKNKFNRVIQAKRQPGSNFKPFIYSAALEKGFTASSLINDAPVVFDDDSLESTWRPENYSGKFYGPTRMREALVKSRNLVSIRLLRAIGLKFAVQYATQFGFEKKSLPYDLSLALGSGTFAPIEIVRAYAVFANGGYLVKPYFIERIESSDGEILFQNNAFIVCQGCEELENENTTDQINSKNQEQINSQTPTKQSIEQESDSTLPEIQYAPRVITAQNAYIMRSMMREVVTRGTAVRAKALGRSDIAGKTGTTNDQLDAWFSGYNDQVVTTAWVGFDSQKPLGKRETGGRAALPMWVDFMREALKGAPINLEEQPEGMVTVRIDSETGERASETTRISRFEIFRTSYAPTEKVVNKIVDQSGNNGGIEPVTEEEITEGIF